MASQDSADRMFSTAPCRCSASCGVMERVAYQEPGSRSRSAYALTPSGRELSVVLSALQQWGDQHLPWPDGPSILRQVRGSDRPAHVGFVDDRGREVPASDVAMIRTAGYPGRG